MAHTAASILAEYGLDHLAPPRRERTPRPGSLSGAVRRWVLDLAQGTLFGLGDLPAPPRAAARIMHDVVNEYYEIERIFKGVYWRGSPIGNPCQVDVPYGRIAMVYAGPGSGYAASTAVNRLGWTTQRTAKVHICAAGRAPNPAHPFIRFEARSNPRRSDLTWAEITLLEGVLHSHRAEPRHDAWDVDANGETDPAADIRATAWADAVGSLIDGTTIRRLGPGASIRPAAVAEAAETEAASAAIRQRAADAAGALPALIEWDCTSETAEQPGLRRISL